MKDSTAGRGPVGVVVMAYGTPASPDDVEAYYTHIRRGRPPAPEQLADLQRRYDALGGTSTLARRTADQVSAIAASLENDQPGRFLVGLGQKHAAPFIEDGVAELAARGASSLVGVVLAPHYSGFSVGQYLDRLGTAADEAGLRATGIERWADLPAYGAFLADAVRDGLATLPARTEVVFTAHSLPERVLAGDPYPSELASSAGAVAEMVGIRARRPGGGGAADALGDPDAGSSGSHDGSADDLRWSTGWQSAGATPEPWRGPDILDVVRDRARSGEVDGLLVCPHGFVADHLEVAYDLDIETKALADDLGLAFARTRVLNDDPAVLGALAERVVHIAAELDR
jgi:ferrochelatase